jgi:hypothetical protein
MTVVIDLSKNIRIRWKNLLTDAEGHSIWFPISEREALESSVKELNLE